jgi:uncharacterized repeat protein (TIGR04076 family)
MMTQCKITVLKRLLMEDLAAEYGPTGLGKCDLHQEGQEYIASLSKPEGLCDDAWKCMYPYVFALVHGVDYFYDNDGDTKPGVAICSCNDGIRPVIFKVEAIG